MTGIQSEDAASTAVLPPVLRNYSTHRGQRDHKKGEERWLINRFQIPLAVAGSPMMSMYEQN